MEITLNKQIEFIETALRTLPSEMSHAILSSLKELKKIKEDEEESLKRLVQVAKDQPNEI